MYNQKIINSIILTVCVRILLNFTRLYVVVAGEKNDLLMHFWADELSSSFPTNNLRMGKSVCGEDKWYKWEVGGIFMLPVTRKLHLLTCDLWLLLQLCITGWLRKNDVDVHSRTFQFNLIECYQFHNPTEYGLTNINQSCEVK